MVFTLEENITLVGDAGCGKTWLLETLKKERFPEGDAATDPFIFVSHKEHDGHEVRVLSFIWDIPAFQDWKNYHPFYYKQTDIIVLCFSIDSPVSLENATKKWLLEIKNYCRPHVPVILVGNKSDLRNDSSSSIKIKKNKKNPFVTPEEGQKTAASIGAYAYVECSARDSESVKEVFKTATKARLNEKHNDIINNPDMSTEKCCTIS